AGRATGTRSVAESSLGSSPGGRTTRRRHWASSPGRRPHRWPRSPVPRPRIPGDPIRQVVARPSEKWYRTCIRIPAVRPGGADLADRAMNRGCGDAGRAMALEGRGEPAQRGEGPPSRVEIEGIRPEIDAGLFPIKRTVGEDVAVSADIFAEGHDLLSAVVKYRAASAGAWSETPMVAEVNDRWSGVFRVDSL